MKILLLSDTDPNELDLSVLKKCEALQILGAFSFRNSADAAPGSFPVRVEVEQNNSLEVFSNQAPKNFLVRKDFNLLRFSEKSSEFQNWQAIPVDGPNAKAISSETSRRAHLVQIARCTPNREPPSDLAVRCYLNPLVAIANVWVEPNRNDVSIVQHCCNVNTTWVDLIDHPEDKLRDVLLESLARRLLWLESKNEVRSRSFVERLIFGKKQGEDHHRAFVGLDAFWGAFWRSSSDEAQPRWTPGGQLTTIATRIAKFWCDCLGVEFSEEPCPQWSIYAAEKYRGHRNLVSDWRSDAEWNSTDNSLRSLSQFMQDHSERSRAGEYLRRFLLRHGQLNANELPLPIRAWNTYSTPSGGYRRLKYADFVEDSLRSLLFSSPVVLELPQLSTELDSMNLLRARREKRDDRFSDRFGNRALDLTYSRSQGASAFLERLITGLSQTDRPSRNKPLSYASEWWKGWEDSLYFSASESPVYFKAPGEGPFYLGVSKFGDKVGLPASELDESTDEHHWVKEIF
ncbi:hypothetical protein LOC67_09115 [Stieleria sp. JC731]|uniref:hypothetical protein n=1 Tax=Pirellulaceae TaxID=2691357 RepID=UPI001E5F3B5D|nr:hypothetical protein [Stieleria sp. JC731]MCC9600722.1 hypothetical protein [Stieleria sp. JC731]